MMSSLRWVYDMMTSDDKVGGWVKKGQNHDDVILECPLVESGKDHRSLMLKIFEGR